MTDLVPASTDEILNRLQHNADKTEVTRSNLADTPSHLFLLLVTPIRVGSVISLSSSVRDLGIYIDADQSSHPSANASRHFRHSCISGCRRWNNITDELTSLPTQFSFRRQLKLRPLCFACPILTPAAIRRFY